MGKQRYISTSFWDDEWVQEATKLQKLFYLYLLSNPLTNIAGIYQITNRRISFDTGFSSKEILDMWEFFEQEKKVYRRGEWLIIPSWPKHQRVSERDNCRKGIDAVLLELPEEIWEAVHDINYRYKYLSEVIRPLKPLEAPYKPLELSRARLDIDSNLNTDTNRSGKVRVFSNNQKLCQAAYKTFETVYGTFLPDNTKQVDAINRLYKLSSDAGEPEVVLQAMMKKFRELKEDDDSKKGFWRTQPFLPTTLVSLWTRVREHLKTEEMKNVDDDKMLEEIFHES